jgi:hypothetical protein
MESRQVHRLIGFIGFSGLFLASSLAHASDYQGVVQSVVQQGTTVFVSVGNGHYGTVNCGTGTVPIWLSIDTTAAGGSTYVALALSAKLTGNSVYVVGNSVCASNAPNANVSEAIAVLYMQ